MAKADADYLLTTKIFCGMCERMMVGESGTSHTGDKHYYYKCAGVKRTKDCKKKSVKKEWIEKAVVVLTVNRVLKDDEISRIADSIIALQESEDTTIPALKKQLADTERGIENMLNAIQQGILTSSTKERLETLERQKESLQTAIAQAELQKPKYTKEQIVSWINQFKYGDADSIEYQKHIIDTFVNAIYLFDDKIVITYNFKGGTETITMKDIEAAYGSDMTLMSPPNENVADSNESATLYIYCTLILLIHNHANSGRSHLAWRQTVSHARAAWRSPWLGCAASRRLRSGCPRWAAAWIRQRRGSLLPYHIGSRCRSCTRRPAGQRRAAGFRQPAAHR